MRIDISEEAYRALRDTAATLSLLDKGLLREWNQLAHATFVGPLAEAMVSDARAAGSHGPAVAGTIKTRRGNMPKLIVGSLDVPQWAGGVFGGQRGTQTEGRKDMQRMRWPEHRSASSGPSRRARQAPLPPSGGTRTGVMSSQSRRGMIARRQTAQFLPHRGKEGYLVFPTWRRMDRELSERLVRAADTFLRERL
jgi:hypothetical protein